ncbi:chemokine-like receptor 1 [Pygocentrus nattereri]|uniref:chemokine-like receptor 1 n=1 Tax=Pygocentrus nattereri TaxID=42514 RepID=UPI001891542E|nr:chemokine-like receptor 1 [Pygocentrus nattereri]
MNSTTTTEPEYSDYTHHSMNQTTDSPPCDAVCIFYAVTNVVIIVLGIAGNGLVIWTAGFKVKKSVVSTWYLSLAMSDFIFCCFLPFRVINMVKKAWLFGRFMCNFSYFILFLNMFSSIFLLVIISVDRCVIVTFPVWTQNHRTVRKASVVVILAWVISAALSTPSAAFLELYKHRTVFFCIYIHFENYVATLACRFIFLFVIPFLIIFICYVVIIRKLKSNQMARSKKPFKIMTVLIVTFLICWLPYHTVILMNLFMPNHKSLYSAYVFSLILVHTNSCLNPFLYAFMGKDIKEHCYALWLKIENAVKEEDDQNTIQGTAYTTSGESRHSTSI